MLRSSRLQVLVCAATALGILVAGYALHVRVTRTHASSLPETCIASSDAPESPGAGMVFIPAGRFQMGSEAYRREEAPVRQSVVEGFWIDSHDVTNAQFARFVAETGYVTVAERNGTPQGSSKPGSFVFAAPDDVTDLANAGQWWQFVAGADWRHPEGPASTIEKRMAHPVVQIAYEDAEAYAHWAGHSLPTETQWEFAARGGLDGATFSWGNEDAPDGAPKANHWRGIFPTLNLGSNGFKGTSPVGCFPANGYGLYDMAGNVWQWTQDRWHGRDESGSVTGPQKASRQFRVIKGGSYLCAVNYCMRYRPAARQPGDVSAGASHIGFRTVLAPPSPELPPALQRALFHSRQRQLPGNSE